MEAEGFVLMDKNGLGVSVLASCNRVRGFKPSRSRRIFRAKKILSTTSFGGEVKPSVPCRNLRHIKDHKMAWISRISRVAQTWRYLAEKVGMSKGGGK